MRKIIAQTATRPASDGRSEDAILSLPDQRIVALADGFGGREGDQGPAARACAAVHQFLVHEAGDREATLPFVMRHYFSLAGNVLFNAIVHANRLLLAENARKSVHARGGASLVAAYLDDEVLSVASVGGCQAWFIRQGRASPLLVPRSWGRWVDPGASALGLAARIPLMALGIHEDLEPEVVEVRVQPGDQVWFGTFEPCFEAGVLTETSLNSGTYRCEESWVLWNF
ncbi:MAG: hypothetical protein RJB38_1789 [Pseudomonadota bacterium]